MNEGGTRSCKRVLVAGVFVLSEYTTERLVAAIAEARCIASQVGPLHAAWDDIFDAECLLSGKPQFIETTMPVLIDRLEQILENRR
jgi:hypothetical protein